MSDKKYWSGFAQLNEESRLELQNRTKDEFAEELPFEDLDGKGLLDAKTPRRDFLKYLGFSTAAATLAASCETPVRKAVPFVNKPENVVPGVAKYYASTYVQDGDALPVIVKVRDGRPIKIEGNDLYPFTKGGTSPRAQASVLDLYDLYRLTNPKRKSGAVFQEIPNFDQVDSQIISALAGVTGSTVLLTSTVVSPSTKQIISEFLAKYPGSRHVQYDAVSYSAMLLANEATQGRRAIPAYNFEKAKAIVSLGADFLGTWLSPVEFARQYSYNRKINETNPTMSKHIQFESFLSMTGASADERYTHRPSETGAVVMALAAALGVGGVTAPALSNAKTNAGIQSAVKALQANRGQALVVCGSNDVNIQILVNAINSAIGAYGTTIDNSVALNYRQGIDADMVSLVNAMHAGQVGALLIYGANPVYEYYDAEKFKQGLSRVKLTVSFNEKMDETTELCQYSIPTHHYLESWGDAEPRTGYISFIQPTIFPLFKTRPFQTSLLKWSGNNTDYETYFRTFWSGRLGSAASFDKALQDGIYLPGGQTPVNTTAQAQPAQQQTDTLRTDGTTERFMAPVITGGGSFNGGGVAGAVTALQAAKANTGNEVVLYQNVAMLTGKQAGNPWLMELPDPITRATWDNYALISTAKAKELDIPYLSTDFEYYQDRPLIEVTANNKKITLPVMVVPGMDVNTIAIAVGYGRSANFSKAIHEGKGVGQNVYPFARFNGTTIEYSNTATTSAEAVGNYKIARVQMHDSYEDRTEVLKETTLATFMARPDEFKHWREELHKDYAPRTGDYRKEGTLYGDHVQPGLKWGMSIDLNSCIGCGACVVACHTENNVPVVGKNEVLRAHEMHWLRIDRYYVSAKEDPNDLKTVIFQPMLCQHCDNAPCENVCPVAATMHSSEGINQMAYNRCIGTRYCANNCPYKVRRFNWADYTGASTHGKLGPNSGVGALNDVVDQMNDELTRMVLNPDVVTRSRGVMEKCTFCIQRTQEGKLKAKMENRPLGADEVQSACAQACPTSAIVFGNVNDSKGQVAQIRQNNQRRNFYVLEQIHTLPNINYLAKIRNTDEVIPPEHGGAAEHARQQQGEPSTPQHEPAKEAH